MPKNIVRKGKDSYDMEYAVKGTDYKGKPLDFNARDICFRVMGFPSDSTD